jgi:hypothetical protein
MICSPLAAGAGVCARSLSEESVGAAARRTNHKSEFRIFLFGVERRFESAAK